MARIARRFLSYSAACRIAGVVLVSLALVSATACGSGDDDGGGAVRSDFTGTWASTSATGHTIVAGTTIELTFTGDTIAAYAGCNRMSGNFTLDGDRLVVGPLATTRMGCEPDLQAQDDWVGGLLGAGPAYDLAGTTLTLRNGSDSLTLERQTP